MVKNFFNIGIIYLLGQILIKGTSFLLIPLYTKYLGTGIYGELAIIDLFFGLFGVFSLYKIYSGCYRFYNELDKNKMISTAFTFALFSSVVQGCFLCIIIYTLCNVRIEFKSISLVLLLAWIRASIQEIIILLKTRYTMEYLVKNIFFIDLFMTILSLLSVVYFVVNKNMGIFGIYLGYIIGSSFVLVYLICDNKKRIQFKINKNIFAKLFKYGFGLIFGDISYILLAMIDRFFLKSYKNLSDVGIYSLGYKFGGLIQIFFIYAFLEVFNPFKFKNYTTKNFEKDINKFYFYYHLLGIGFIMIISLNIKFILYLFTTEDFLSSYIIVPLIAYSYLLYGQSNFYKTALQLKNKTNIDSLVIFCGCMINIILNFLLIKSLGMIGAALSTIISYFIMNIIYYKISNFYLKIVYEKKQIYSIILLSVGVYFVYYIISISYIDIFKQTIYANLLLVIYFLSNWFIVINVEQKKEIICYLTSILLKLKKLNK